MYVGLYTVVGSMSDCRLGVALESQHNNITFMDIDYATISTVIIPTPTPPPPPAPPAPADSRRIKT